MIKAIIYDLDNTLYPVPSIGEKLFEPVFKLIAESGAHAHDMDAIKRGMMRTPFRLVAQRYGLSEELVQKSIAIQEELTFDEPIAAFDDYPEILKLPAERYLVTTGFEKMQQSKIDCMGVRGDFTEVHVVDPTRTSKKEVFSDIIRRHGYSREEVLVVGDDPESELKAARELGLAQVLYDRDGQWPHGTATHHIKSFHALRGICASM